MKLNIPTREENKMLVYLMIVLAIMLAVMTELFSNKVVEGNSLPLKLNLQFFAGEDNGGSGDDGGDGGSGDGDEGGDEGGDDQGGDKGDQGDKTKKNPKTFSQEDVNAIASKEAKKAQEKLFRELGVKDAKTAKEALTKFQEMQDSQKSEAQKAIDRAKALEEEKNGLSSKAQLLEAKLAAFTAGVKVDSLDDVIVLASNLTNDDTTMDEAIAKVLEKYPHFKAVADAKDEDDDKDEKDTKAKKKPKFSDGDHKSDKKPTDQEAWGTAFAWGEKKD